MKKLLMLVLSMALIFVMAACTATKQTTTDSEKDGKKTNEESQAEKVLNLNNGQEPTSYDPIIGFDAVSWNSLNNLMEGLTRLGKTNEAEAATAENWDVSEDGKTYTFHIRDDAKWSNGDDLVAGDFVYAWKRLLDPTLASSASFLAYFIEGAEAYNTGTGSVDDVKVSATDDKTFVVTLNSPQAYFLSVITNPCFFPINEKVATEDPEWFTEADSFVGNGPFSLNEWIHDSNIVMVKNDNYWDKESVNIDKINWAMVADTSTEYQMFTNGELDVSDVPTDLSEQLASDERLMVSDQSGEYFYRFNTTMEPFRNANIRKAFAMAVDQKQMVEYVTKNQEKEAYGFVSYGFADPSGADFREKNGNLVSTDVEEAKKLLAKGMEEEGYKELPEVTLTYSTLETHQKIAEALQQMFKDNLGVEVKLANMEANVFATDQKALKFQLSRSSFLADYADPINYLENFQTGHSMNRTGWSNSKYDQLIKDAKNEADEEKRFEIMYEAEKLLFDEMPIIPIHFYNHVNLQSEAVSGIVRHPVGYLELKWADKTE